MIQYRKKAQKCDCMCHTPRFEVMRRNRRYCSLCKKHHTPNKSIFPKIGKSYKLLPFRVTKALVLKKTMRQMFDKIFKSRDSDV